MYDLNRKEKYKRLRFQSHLRRAKFFGSIIFVFQLWIFTFGLTSIGSFAYFTAQYSTDFSIKNATKEELVEISEGDLIYDTKKNNSCVAKKSVTIKNIFDYPVKITISGNGYKIKPGESITHTEVVEQNCNINEGDRSFKIIGFENYFDHEILVSVIKQEKPCPPASDNGNGKPNDNGNGKKCGHNENRLHEDSNQDLEIEIPNETIPEVKADTNIKNKDTTTQAPLENSNAPSNEAKNQEVIKDVKIDDPNKGLEPTVDLKEAKDQEDKNEEKADNSNMERITIPKDKKVESTTDVTTSQQEITHNNDLNSGPLVENEE